MKHICTDVDECATGNDTCDPDATCTNTLGSYKCDPSTGFSGGGVELTDADEEYENNGNIDNIYTCALVMNIRFKHVKYCINVGNCNCH